MELLQEILHLISYYPC